jgi:hypothetical protein
MDWFTLMWKLYYGYFLTAFFIVIVFIVWWYFSSKLVTHAEGHIQKDENGFYWKFISKNTGITYISKQYFSSINSAEWDMRKKLREKGIIVD